MRLGDLRLNTLIMHRGSEYVISAQEEGYTQLVRRKQNGQANRLYLRKPMSSIIKRTGPGRRKIQISHASEAYRLMFGSPTRGIR